MIKHIFYHMITTYLWKIGSEMRHLLFGHPVNNWEHSLMTSATSWSRPLRKSKTATPIKDTPEEALWADLLKHLWVKGQTNYVIHSGLSVLNSPFESLCGSAPRTRPMTYKGMKPSYSPFEVLVSERVACGGGGGRAGYAGGVAAVAAVHQLAGRRAAAVLQRRFGVLPTVAVRRARWLVLRRCRRTARRR